MHNRLQLHQMPAFLFHGSPRKDLACLRPAPDKPLHASDDIRLAVAFLARPAHCICARSSREVRVWIAEQQADFCRRDQGGSIYVVEGSRFLPLGSGSVPADGWEYITHDTVAPLLKIDYSSAFAAFQAHGVKVEFVSWESFTRLDTQFLRLSQSRHGLTYASGILPVSRNTGRICLAWRSRHVHFGQCWGTFGGAVPLRQSLRDSAQRELKEETGYEGEIQLHAAGAQARDSFRYHTFVGIVPEEFSLSPSGEHAWETDHIAWRSLNDWQETMRLRPDEFHPGVLHLFRSNLTQIQSIVQLCCASEQS